MLGSFEEDGVWQKITDQILCGRAVRKKFTKEVLTADLRRRAED